MDTQIDAASLRLSQRPGQDAGLGSRGSVGGSGGPTGQAASTAAARGRSGRDEAVSRDEETTPLRQAIRALCEAGAPDVYQTVEDALFLEVFRYCHYSQSETARVLGISRNIVRSRLIRLGEVGGPRRLAGGDGEPAQGAG